MLFPVAGSKLFIATGELAPAGWTEIRSAESFGTVGVEWELVDATAVASPHAEFLKGLMRPHPMQIVLFEDFEDAGQVMLWQAARSEENYWFQIRFPVQGAVQPIRQWRALVIDMGEAFDGANSAIKLLATLQLNSDIERLGETP